MESPVQTSTAVPNKYLAHDGRDPGAAMKDGLEITGICVIGLAVILTLYYTSLRILTACFPSKKEHAKGHD